jgi:hypothetical protein
MSADHSPSSPKLNTCTSILQIQNELQSLQDNGYQRLNILLCQIIVEYLIT